MSDDEDSEDSTKDPADESLDGDDEPLVLGKPSHGLFDMGDDEELAAFDDEDFDDDFDDDFEEEDDEYADDDVSAEAADAKFPGFGDDDDEDDGVIPDDED